MWHQSKSVQNNSERKFSKYIGFELNVKFYGHVGFLVYMKYNSILTPLPFYNKINIQYHISPVNIKHDKTPILIYIPL